MATVASAWRQAAAPLLVPGEVEAPPAGEHRLREGEHRLREGENVAEIDRRLASQTFIRAENDLCHMAVKRTRRQDADDGGEDRLGFGRRRNLGKRM